MNTRRALAVCLCLLLTPLSARAQDPRLVVQNAHAEGVNAVAFSPDGKVIATASGDGTVKLWHAATGAELLTPTGFYMGATSVAFSQDGELLAAVSTDQTFRAWSASSGRVLFHINPNVGPLRAVAVSPDHKVLAFGGDGPTFLHEVVEGKDEPAHLGAWSRGAASGVHGLAFHPRGKVLAAGCDDKTVKILEAPKGKLLHTLTGHTRTVTAVAFSPDGKLLASAGEDGTVRLWKWAAEAPLFTLKGHTGKVNTVAFSPDGKAVVSGGEDRTIRFWDPATGEARGTPRVLPHTVNALAFAADGHTLVSGTKQVPAAAVWNVTAEYKVAERRQLLHGVSDKVYAVAVAPNGRAIATGMNHSIALWRLGAARQLITIAAHAEQVSAVAFSPDSKYLVSGSLDRQLKLWNARSGHLLHAVHGHSSDIPAVAFSPDGKTLASVGLDRFVNLWHVRDDKLHAGKKLAMEGPAEQFFSVTFSPDGGTLAAGSLGQVRRWDLGTGEAQPPLKGDSKARYLGVTFSPDGKTIVGACQTGSLTLWDAGTGKPQQRLTTPNTDKHYWPGCMETVAFSPDGALLVGGSDDRTIHLWDAATNKPLPGPPPRKGDEPRPLVLRQGQTVKSVAFTADGRFLVSGSGRGMASGHGDGQVKIWSVPKGGGGPRLLCTLVAFADGSWAVVDPRGLYDASDGGNVPWLHWVSHNEPIALAQLRERYYEPRLLAKLLGLNDEPLRGVKKDIKDLKPSPHVAVAPPDPKTKKMTVKVSDAGGGVGRVQVLVNGKEVVAEARADKVDPKTGEAEVQVDLSKVPTLRGKGDQVRVVAWNKDGDLAGRGMVRDLDDDDGVKPAAPELYAVVVGVSTYKAPRLNLKFAADDAEQMGRALEKGAQQLFGANKVHLTVLSSKKGTVPATKANIQEAFEKARKARPGDVLVVFLAGHGLALPGDQDLYCYLTQDADSLSPADYAQIAVRAANAVTSEELVDWIKQVPALKQVMMLDTCASGAVALPLGQRRDVSSSQIRAVERIKERTGFHVLMGCAADKVSYEASQFEHGLLTYAVLEGMKGPGVELGEVQADKLFRYAARRVPQLARGIGGVQEPLVSSPINEPVAVAKLAPGDVLLKAQTCVARPVLRNVATDDDNKKVAEALRKRLKELAGRGLAAVYVDEEDMEDAIRPTGNYTVKGDSITVNLRLRRNDDVVAELDPIEGTAGDLPALANRIVVAIVKALPKR